MTRYLFLLLSLLVCFTLQAQGVLSVKGKLVDSLDVPIEAVTVYLSKQKDSTLVEYALSDFNGRFSIDIQRSDTPLILRTNLLGFTEFVKNFDKGMQESVDLGDIVLQEQSWDLDELIITANVAPIRILKDTLEFNAASFKVRPDANLDLLLRELPGVQIDQENNITVNGQPVGEILVNGKPFFSSDGKIALENLPADIVNKIQVTEKKTKTERFTKSQAKSDQASINITIDEDKNKGYFGRVSAGYGSNSRYESALFLNSFTQNTKFSVIGSANNINATGFSMDDVFDNMSTSKGSSGITQSKLLGANIDHTFSEKLSANGSYNYNYSDTENWNKRLVTRFLPDGQFTSDSFSTSNQANQGQSANASVDYISKKDAFFLNPQFSSSNSSFNREANERTFSEDSTLLNQSESQTYGNSNGNSFSNTMRYIRNFDSHGQYLSIEFSNSNSINSGDTYNNSLTEFFQNENSNENRRQFQRSHTTSDAYVTSLSYNRSISDSLKYVLGVKWDYQKSISDLDVFDYDYVSQDYSIVNASQSNRYSSNQNKLSPFAHLSWNRTKYSFFLQGSLVMTTIKANGLYNSENYQADKKYVNPDIGSTFRYFFNKNDQLNIRYNYGVTYQSATQLLAITDLSNPLNTIIGNPDLKPTNTHTFNLGFRSYNFQKRSGYSVNLNNSLYGNNIVSSVEYDSDRKATSTYKNISGSYQIQANADWFKTAKWQEHSLRIGVGVRFSNSLKKGFVDGQSYKAYSNVFSPRVYVSYQLGDDLIIKPFYNYTHNETTYSNFRVDKASSFIHNLGFQTTSYWPKNFVFGNDLSYNYNSQIASGFQKDYYMWNMSLAYDFFKNKFRAKVKVYDLLNQNTSALRTIDPMQIVDSESLVLKQYVMFSLVYNLNAFGNKGPKEGRKTFRRSEFR